MGEPLNPYESPQSDLDTAIPATQSTTPIDMPPSVKATVSIVVAVLLMAGYRGVVAGSFPVLQLGLLGFLLWGLFAKKSLAWQYVRVIGVLVFIGTVVAVVNVAFAISRSFADPKALTAAQVVLVGVGSLFVLPVFLISTQKARLYFGVVCPACGSTARSATKTARAPGTDFSNRPHGSGRVRALLSTRGQTR